MASSVLVMSTTVIAFWVKQLSAYIFFLWEENALGFRITKLYINPLDNQLTNWELL